MAEDLQIKGNTKEEKYQSIIPQIKALVDGETDAIANMANVCAALKYGFNFFWVGSQMGFIVCLICFGINIPLNGIILCLLCNSMFLFR